MEDDTSLLRQRRQPNPIIKHNDDDDDDDDQIKKQQNISCYICTWNVNMKQPPFGSDLNELIRFDEQNLPDLCVFGLQEVKSTPFQRLIDFFFNDPWTNQLTDTLHERFDFIRVKKSFM